MNSAPIDVVIIGGGAAGFFTAINLAEQSPDVKVVILERGKDVLTKVRISGGGRCNVTHAEFLPSELVKNYPRGEKELLGPFHKFMTGDTIGWFEERGVALKIEEDGRMFPTSDTSESIINCFLKEAKEKGIEVKLNHAVQHIEKTEASWIVQTTKGTVIAKNLVVATGSNPKIWQMLQQLGHQLVPPVPSLFTFHNNDKRISGLAGISTQVALQVVGSTLENAGPMLITHWGFSGPAVLKLSAWGAREFYDNNYHFQLRVNWTETLDAPSVLEDLKTLKLDNAKQQISKYAQFGLTKRLWQSLVDASGISFDTKWADLNKQQLQELSRQLTAGVFQITGKSTFKEEFVTAGGVDLKEIDFKTFQSKKHPRLYLAGEVLNIDAVTGGFNFQNCWTGGFLVAQAITEAMKNN